MAKSKLLLMPEYRAWADMKTRCTNPKHKSYSRYGGRGITFEARWQGFEAFFADMGPKPSRAHTLERNDLDGPYSHENCCWADRLQQANSKSNNHLLTFEGRTQTLAQWAREVGLTDDALERRLNLLRWPTPKALTTPPRGWGPGKPRIS